MKTLLAILLILPTLASAGRYAPQYGYDYATGQTRSYDLKGARRSQAEAMMRQQMIQENNMRQLMMQQEIMQMQRYNSMPQPPMMYPYPGRW